MIADVRRAVAVASYVMVTNRVDSSVFDFANGGYHLMSVSHTGNFLSVYDYQRSNYLSGYLPNLFDYSTASYVNMMMSGNTINGFEHFFEPLRLSFQGESYLSSRFSLLWREEKTVPCWRARYLCALRLAGHQSPR